MRQLLVSVFASLILSLTVSTSSAQQIYTPDRGTAERKAILNAVRPILEVRVGTPVEFVVSFMRVYENWAWVSVDPQRPGGGKIDPNAPNYRMWEDMDNLSTYVLLKYAYGQWNVVDYAIGPTDVFWDGDPLYKQFPRAFTFPQ